MIVSTIFTAALDCVPVDAGAGAPHVGISPASAEIDRTHVKATVISNFLIDCFSFGNKKMQRLLHRLE